MDKITSTIQSLRCVLKQKTVLLAILLVMSISTGKSLPTENVNEANHSNSTVEMVNYNEDRNAGNTKLIPIPHIMCTEFSVSGVVKTCFPAGCICDDGAGVCNLFKKCVHIQVTVNWNRDLENNDDKDFLGIQNLSPNKTADFEN